MTFILKAGLIANLCTLTLFSVSPNTETNWNNGNLGKEVSMHNPSAAQDEQFDAFFKRFNRHADFQLASIVFPLKKITVDDDNKQTVEYISKRAWRYINFAKIQYVVITKDKVSKRDVTILLQIEETGVHIQYKFVSKAGKWYLTLITDEST
ncbi:DUF4348 domain-containing protein [Mucilaginibacter sp. Bleaf8]|uniref:DUF4348 domain-containing protein n=1 Tax=Mucilaginibacter sp. Bleaf8 TaxID=2834430 RepID=UPI001BD0AA4A|nr:DUF4348 domain-containing protein [Mucilaginibacter sp. Bleaf8]MBS7565759.1 DUF4348 domain-containing protein [Mucilaginibacter sp. Bleaf8]